MARTELATQVADQNGLTVAYTAANVDGHWIDPDTILIVKNTNAATRTITLQTAETRAGLTVAEQTVVVAATTGEQHIHVPKAEQPSFVQPVGGTNPGKIYVDFSAVTDVTVAAIGW